jgi:hypothetical protein
VVNHPLLDKSMAHRRPVRNKSKGRRKGKRRAMKAT